MNAQLFDESQARGGPRRVGPARRRPTRFVPVTDALEGRRLLTAGLVDGVLTVEGTAGDDILKVSTTAEYVQVEGLSGGTRVFDASDVREIIVNGGEGDDSISYRPGALAPPIAVTLRGSLGNDSIDIGDDARNVTVHGGQGDDRIIRGHNTSTVVIYGGEGQNTIKSAAQIEQDHELQMRERILRQEEREKRGY